MVITGDRKLIIYKEAACENVGQPRLLSNNCLCEVSCICFTGQGWDLGEEWGRSRESLKGDIGSPALGKELAGLRHLRVQCSNLERPSQLSSVGLTPSCVYTTDRHSLLHRCPSTTYLCLFTLPPGSGDPTAFDSLQSKGSFPGSLSSP